MNFKKRISVLIVGAGPTGLALALWLRKSGIDFRIIDKEPVPSKGSCAVMVHARTLEFYKQLGIASEIMAAGNMVSDIQFNFNKRKKVKARLEGQSSTTSGFPAVLVLAQDIHERILIEKLQSMNVVVERNIEFKTFTQGKYLVESIVKSKTGENTISSTYLCACDGSESVIRKILGVKFFKKSFIQNFFITDVKARGVEYGNSININLTPGHASISLALRPTDSVRIMGIVPKASENKENLSFVNISDEVVEGIDLEVDEVTWFSVYRVNQRVASHIRQGRTFLIGDAAHIHSPSFSQGMNAGIGDAINLGWKLSAVLKGQASQKILLTFEAERIAFAEKLNKVSDRFFYFISARNPVSAISRAVVFPLLLKIFRNFRPFFKYVYKNLSQTGLNYRESLLSEGAAGKIRAGDRLPWVRTEYFDNYDSLNSRMWQIHIYGKTDSNFNSVANFRGFTIFEFRWNKQLEAAGFTRDAFYLVRPDGYIALCNIRQNPAVLKKYLNEWDINQKEDSKSEMTPELVQPESQL